MKKFVLVLLLFFLLVYISNDSYSYVECDNTIIYPIEVSTKNLNEYLNNYNYFEINYLCYYDNCYKVREGDLDLTIERFIKTINIDNEQKEIFNIRGFPITKISLNTCE